MKVSYFTCRVRTAMVYVLPILCGLLFACAWLLLDWRDFDSDQAFGGLASRHVLEGEFRIYPWGQKYFGGLLFYPVAFSLWLFGEDSILAFRLPFMLMFIFWMSLTVVLASRLWGKKTALLTAWIAFLPGQYLLRFINGHSATFYGILSIACFFLVLPSARRLHLSPASRSLLLGALIGFGYWHSPSFLVTILAVGTTLVMMSPEWQKIWDVIRSKKGDSAVLATILILVGAIIVALALTLLSGGDRGVARVGTLLLIVLALIFSGAFLISSDRKVAVVKYSAFILFGCILGNTPQWLDWFFTGIAPDARLRFVIPTVENLQSLAGILWPSFVGVPPLSEWPDTYGLVRTVFFASALFSSAACIFYWLWLNRIVWKKCARGYSLNAAEAASFAVSLMFVIPWVSLVFLFPYDEGQVRYVLEVWPFWSLIVGMVIARIRRVFAIPLLLMLVISSLAATGIFYFSAINRSDGAFAPHNVERIEAFFAEHDVQSGYANYWSAYAIDYLVNERIILTPYYGADRYPPYNQIVSGARRFAFVISQKSVSPYPQAIETLRIPTAAHTTSQLLEAIMMSNIVQPRYQYVLERIGRSRSIAREKIGYWDVWLLEDPTVMP